MFKAEDILERVKKQPFAPLRIVTSSGDFYEIHHPDLIMIGQRLLVVGTASAKNPAWFDKVSQVSILHITALENLPAPASAGGNGQA